MMVFRELFSDDPPLIGAFRHKVGKTIVLTTEIYPDFDQSQSKFGIKLMRPLGGMLWE